MKLQEAELGPNITTNVIPTIMQNIDLCLTRTIVAFIDCCVSPALEEGIYFVRSLAINTGVKPALGCLVNVDIQIVQVCIDVAHKRAVVCIFGGQVAVRSRPPLIL